MRVRRKEDKGLDYTYPSILFRKIQSNRPVVKVNQNKGQRIKCGKDTKSKKSRTKMCRKRHPRFFSSPTSPSSTSSTSRLSPTSRTTTPQPIVSSCSHKKTGRSSTGACPLSPPLTSPPYRIYTFSSYVIATSPASARFSRLTCVICTLTLCIQHVRVYLVRVLLDLVPQLLVEPGRVPRACDAHGCLPLDGRLSGTSALLPFPGSRIPLSALRAGLMRGAWGK